MAKQVQLRRGTSAEHAAFTGVEGELTVDTTKDTIVLHDAYQAGGFPLLREDLNNLAAQAVDITKISVTGSSGNWSLRVNPAGTGLEYINSWQVTLLFSAGVTESARSVTLSESLRNFKFLIFQSSNWSNLHVIPVEVFTAGVQHMLATYSTYHSYVQYTNDTTIQCEAGSGNTAYKIWGIK